MLCLPWLPSFFSSSLEIFKRIENVVEDDDDDLVFEVMTMMMM